MIDPPSVRSLSHARKLHPDQSAWPGWMRWKKPAGGGPDAGRASRARSQPGSAHEQDRDCREHLPHVTFDEASARKVPVPAPARTGFHSVRGGPADPWAKPRPTAGQAPEAARGDPGVAIDHERRSSTGSSTGSSAMARHRATSIAMPLTRVACSAPHSVSRSTSYHGLRGAHTPKVVPRTDAVESRRHCPKRRSSLSSWRQREAVMLDGGQPEESRGRAPQ